MSAFLGDGAGNEQHVSGDVSADSLLRRPVRLRGIRLGHPVDALLDVAAMRVVGLEILCGDGIRRFLPLPAARVREDEIAVGSALLLLEGGDLSFYRRRGRLLSALRGRTVTLAGQVAGVLRDVLLDADGAVTHLEVERGDGRGGVRVRVPPDGRVAIDEAPASAA